MAHDALLESSKNLLGADFSGSSEIEARIFECRRYVFMDATPTYIWVHIVRIFRCTHGVPNDLKSRMVRWISYVFLGAYTTYLWMQHWLPLTRIPTYFRVQHTRTYKCKVNVFMGAVQKHWRRTYSTRNYVFTGAPNFPCQGLWLRNFMCMDWLKSSQECVFTSAKGRF